MFINALLVCVLLLSKWIVCDDTASVNHLVAFGDSYTGNGYIGVLLLHVTTQTALKPIRVMNAMDQSG